MHQSKTPSKFGFDDFVAVMVLLGAVFGCVWLIGGGFTAEDTDVWTPLDTDKRCFLHTTQDRNWWLTPGETQPEVRDIYCLQEAS